MQIREPAVAGQFYPRDPRELRRMVEQFCAALEPGGAERVAAVIAPHAGYIYSGPTAGYAYARIRGKTPGRVFLLGSSHRYAIHGASVFQSGAFDTPLGSFPVDDALAGTLAREWGSHSEQPHLSEHSLEVQLPFLWVVLGETPIVPILFGGAASSRHIAMGRRLAELAGQNDLVVASTDLSHYLSQEDANAVDRATLDVVLAQDPVGLVDGVEAGTCSLCGSAAVVAAMAYANARGASQWHLLDYRTSADTSGDYQRVVGYAAVSMEWAE